jgi:transcriptional regulator with XRE-family HTH domain
MKQLVSQLRAARIARGWTIRQLARKCGYAPNTVQRWEESKFEPRPQALIDWANSLDYDVSITLALRRVYEKAY